MRGLASVFVGVFVLLVSMPTEIGADWPDRFGAPAKATFREIRETPKAYLERVVQIEARFDRFDEVYNPVYTRFVPERYLNFSAWGEEQLLYKEDEFSNPFPYLFMDKTHPEIKSMHQLERFEPIVLTCYIHDFFQDMVWIDVVGVCGNDAGVVNERILGHIARGREDFRLRRYDDCLREFKDALEYRLPKRYAGDLQMDVALLYYYKKYRMTGDFLEAAEIELQKAVVLNPDHLYLRRLYARVREENRLAEEEGRRKKTRHGTEEGSE